MSHLTELAAQIANCHDCDLSQTRTNAVPGVGPENAEVVFVGEGPGHHEDQQGKPFVGPSGQFLNDLIRVAGMDREQVFICNVVKCRPPNNRDPLPAEIAACRTYLERQIAIIQPKVVVTLGRYSLQHFLPGHAISRVHGKPMLRDGQPIFPMYHPAAALHQGGLRAVIIEDMKKLPAVLARARTLAAEPASVAISTRAPQLQPEQGRLL